MENNDRFSDAVSIVLNNVKERNSIGLLQEKSVHAILKNYLEPDASKHEVRVGDYIADICSFSEREGCLHITEIQTRNFNLLKEKLIYFLQKNKVTLVYPISYNKSIIKLDKDTYEVVGKPRRSPQKGIPQAIFPELYKIKDLLENHNLTIKIIMLNVTEYRFSQTRLKRGKQVDEKYDIIPHEIVYELCINKPEDYLKLLPEGLPESFTTNDLKAILKASKGRIFSSTVNVMRHIGVLELIGKQGRANLYKVKY